MCGRSACVASTDDNTVSRRRLFVFFFKQKTADEMRISDWSSDVCSSDLFKIQDNEAADFRLEYRHGDDFLWLKPWGGLEVTSDGAVWGGVGVLIDITFFDAVVLTGSFAPGLYEDGNGKDLGHLIEFRSQVELGYQFENQSRLALAFSHLSNGSLNEDNPGVEVLDLYYHIPLDLLF